MKRYEIPSTCAVSPIAARYIGTPDQMSDAPVCTTTVRIAAQESPDDVVRVSGADNDRQEVIISIDDHVKKRLILSFEQQRSTQISRIVISAGAQAHLSLVIIIPEAEWSQTEVAIDHLASHAQVDIALVGVVSGSSRAAVITRQHHVSPDAVSSIMIKTLLDESGKFFHHGSITVEQEARLSIARQKTTAILCSDHARAWSIPTLEVIPHEVSCAHGAAMGQVDDHQIMYAQSRGIPAHVARRMILQGFLADALRSLPESYQMSISKELIDRVCEAQ